MQKQKIEIDIVSDVACPWCYVGIKRLEIALEKLTETHVAIVTWHPFELNQEIPKAGANTLQFFANKFGSMAKTQEIFNHMKSVGAPYGIQFNFENMPKAINTRTLHCLLHAAKKEGFQHELSLALFAHNFEKGTDLSETKELIQIMKEFGWSEEKTTAFINSNKLEDEVIEQEAYYKQLGVNSVPFFILNKKYGVSGAQSPEVFTEAILEASKEKV